MSTGAGTKDCSELAPVVPQPSLIEVHIHQESALAKLLLATCLQLRSWAHLKGTTTQASNISQLLVASWVMQILLGILSGVLGGFLYICNYSYLLSSGAAIWTGVLAMLAGTVAFFHEQKHGNFWGFLRTLLALTAFSTAVAAIRIGANELYWDPFHNGYYICDSSSQQSWPTPPVSTLNPEEARRLHLCLSYMDMLVALYRGFQTMLLGVWILLLVASLAPVVPLVCLCLHCWRKPLSVEEWDQKDMLVMECSPTSA
ncbi:transmembrane protein 176A [Orycteropus afer afer]|uniref:Transmembrane protein 176A n=1 Tax=Orycteropus afer afer TaxID=1230840 RepID=A0AC54ZBW6_ORYAF|nr:transmembrane protein 176A [Orycteropus afer afer]